MKNIKNYNVLIAGASGDIGNAIISSLTGKVSTITCLNRKFNETIIIDNTKVDFIKAELDKMDDWNVIVSLILNKYKKIDLFINCIGKVLTGSLNSQETNEIEKLISANLMLHIYGLKAIIPAMLRQQHGQIIEIGSLGGVIPMPFVSTYSASKFALRGLVLSVREELKNSGVNISLLNPGPVHTKLLYVESKNPDAVISFAQRAISAGNVAQAVIQLINHPRGEMTIPVSNKYSALIANRFPNLFYCIYSLLDYIGSRKRISLEKNS